MTHMTSSTSSSKQTVIDLSDYPYVQDDPKVRAGLILDQAFVPDTIPEDMQRLLDLLS